MRTALLRNIALAAFLAPLALAASAKTVTIVHESTHKLQNERINDLLSGKIAKSNPDYDRVRLVQAAALTEVTEEKLRLRKWTQHEAYAAYSENLNEKHARLIGHWAEHEKTW